MKTAAKILLAFTVLSLAACKSGPSACDQWAADFRDNSELNMVLTKFEKNGAMVFIYGKNPATGATMEFRDSSGWIGGFYKKMDVGDTILKKKGSYMTLLKKTSYVVKVPCKCEDNGQEYSDK